MKHIPSSAPVGHALYRAYDTVNNMIQTEEGYTTHICLETTHRMRSGLGALELLANQLP